ncbi:MAG: GtrA family protein [Candidatus Woesearchaeota archaeon]
MKKTKIAILYGVFAIISILANMFSQFLFFSVYKGPFYIYIGLMIGTLVGLIVKYLLDKKWIFYYVAKSKLKDLQTFILYSFMGVFTTIIFWGFELGFYFYFQEFVYAKYVGGTIGLIIGYIVKYFLDKKFVFKK